MSKMDGKFTLGEYTLTFNINTFCDLEEEFEVADVNGVMKVLADFEEAPSMRVLRRIFLVALKQDHPDITPQEAGVAITAVGMGRSTELLGEAVQAAFPEMSDDDDDVGNAPKNVKTKPKRGNKR